MKVIPVLDLKNGVVVRGVAGDRQRYRPVNSMLAADARPANVARGLVQHFGFEVAYVADLDAIAGDDPAWPAYREISTAGLELLVDAGVGHLERERPAGIPVGAWRSLSGMVVGLESVSWCQQLATLAGIVGAERAVFSLDLKRGVPLTNVQAWQDVPPESIAGEAIEAGFRRLIVLDLARVGVGEGPSVHGLCRRLRKTFPKIELISGGGVRNVADIDRLCEAGCDAVLVASAFHNGSISPADLQRFH